MTHDTERFVQIERIQRIQARVRDLHGFDGGEALRIVIESELVEAAREGYERGKRYGLDLAKRAPANASGSPAPASSSAGAAPERTPVFSPRAAIEVNATTPFRRKP